MTIAGDDWVCLARLPLLFAAFTRNEKENMSSQAVWADWRAPPPPDGTSRLWINTTLTDPNLLDEISGAYRQQQQPPRALPGRRGVFPRSQAKGFGGEKKTQKPKKNKKTGCRTNPELSYSDGNCGCSQEITHSGAAPAYKGARDRTGGPRAGFHRRQSKSQFCHSNPASFHQGAMEIPYMQTASRQVHLFSN